MKSGGGMDILKIALIGGAGYWLYTTYLQPAAAATTTGGGTVTPPASGGSAAAPAATPPAATPAASSSPTAGTAAQLVTDLNAAAYGNSAFSIGTGRLSGTADQWNYYRNQLRPPALTADQFGAAFPGMTATDRGPMMYADDFVAKLQGANVGLGAVFIPVPIRIPMANGRPMLVWGLHRARGTHGG
jgi:hypothetical protein